MASISEILIGQADQTIKSTKEEVSFADSIGKGVNMYSQVAKIALEKEQLEQAKAEHKTKKEGVLSDMIGQYITNADKVSGIKGLSPQRKEQILLGMRDSMPAIKNFIPEDTVKMQIADPNVKAKIAQAQSDLKGGKIDFATYTKTLGDAVALDSYGADPSFYYDEALEGASKAEDTRIGAQAQRDALMATNSRFQQGEERQSSQYEKTQAQDKREKLQGEITKLGLPVMGAKLDNLNAIIPGGLDKYKSGDIPGFGGYRAKLPIGQVSPEERKNRQELLQLGNSVIKKVTGAGGGEKEMNRILRSIGMEVAIGEGGGFTSLVTGASSSSDIVAGIRAIKKEYQADSDVLKKTYGADLYSEIAGGSKSTPPPPTGTPDLGKLQSLYDASKGDPAKKAKILEAAKAKGLKIKE